MKNQLTLLIAVLVFVYRTHAQPGPLMIAGESGKFYISHVVVAKENWYSIGRMFNLSPREIAPYNGLNMDKALDIGQQLKVPLTPGNFIQKDSKTEGEALVPVYHIVQEKEWMFRLSAIYNDVSVSNLEKWNHIKRDDVKPGMSLIVGYLRVKTGQSPLAGSTDKPPATAVSTQPVNQPPQTAVQTAAVAVPVAAETGAVNPARMNTYASEHSTGGFFSIDFSGTGKSASGMAATFKSTSGWNDGKYYALMNNVPVGTIIKVTVNGKSVYAKVLGQLPEMKESTGLLIRISNAASAELGTGEVKFPVDVRY
jgi:LysM repeat protein